MLTLILSINLSIFLCAANVTGRFYVLPTNFWMTANAASWSFGYNICRPVTVTDPTTIYTLALG
ncbi:hypothetical protein AFE_1739 [Acidithiobacillus ferrooxidans ATCC 23270]|uniref:Uncharacterized protein n=1 Tax=Acidithiobacillus ferrooxidans (strain ATCC 23270 / DSM 14882 / CIP 104768 / NCIMB 8455) TaxID=243159 RepID=B7JBJ7_ACIF2|nr:hypothetical protein AFE_1739 [Acidithiobacillus ferrooxidans ATCC 23270]